MTTSHREARPPARPGRTIRALVLVGLAVIVLAAFAGVLRAGWLHLDDPGYVTENPHVNAGPTLRGVLWSLHQPHGGNWHPLTSLSHMLDVRLFGLRAWGHHATSLALHLLNVLLLALVLRRLTGAWWRSVLVAALFGLHPLRVESVAWISERKDVLSGLFFLLTLEAYRRWVARPGAARRALVTLSLALGLMSKPMLVTTPFVLVLLDIWPLGRLRGPARAAAAPAAGDRSAPPRRLPGLLLEKWPLLILAAASAFLTLRFQRVAGAVASTDTASLAGRLANAALSCWRYVGKIVWPARLSPHYDFVPVSPLTAVVAATALAAVTALAVWGARRRSPAAIGWLWYVGMLVPVIGIVQVGMQAYADRYTYLPGVGLLIAVVWPIGGLVATSRARRTAAAAVAVLAVAALTVATARQTAAWRDTRTLYRHALRAGGESVMVLNGLATACAADSQHAEAVGYLRRAVELAPNYANSYVNLGVSLARLGRYEESADALRRACELAPARADAFRYLGLSLQALGRNDEAADCFRRALALQPDDADALDQLGVAAVLDGRVAEGLALFRRAAALAGASRRPHLKIALALLSQPGNDAAAAEHLRQAVRDRPDDPETLNGCAWLLATSADPAVRDGGEAARLAARAVALTGGRDPNVLDTQAAALAAAGRHAEAAQAARTALALAQLAHADSLVVPIRARLALYERGRAWVDSARAVGAAPAPEPHARTVR